MSQGIPACRAENIYMPLRNGKAPQARLVSVNNCTERSDNGKSLFAELFGQDAYDQLLRERNLRLLDEPFGRAMMMAEFCEKEAD